MRTTAQLLAGLLLLVICLHIQMTESQISGLPLATAAALGIGGVGASILGGAALGGLAAAATNALRGGNRRTNSNTRSYMRRGRREAVPPAADAVDVDSVIETLFAMDQLDCGKRYLCELSASPLGSLNKDEKRSLTILQGKPVAGEAVGLGRILFHEAVILGTNTKDTSVCQARYKSCDTGKTTMMELIRSLEDQPDLRDVNDV